MDQEEYGQFTRAFHSMIQFAIKQHLSCGIIQRGLARLPVTFAIPSATEIGCWPVRAASRMRFAVQQSGAFIFNGLPPPATTLPLEHD